MKILLISTEFLPIYNTKGEGAIQQLERIYLDFNESTNDEIIVYVPKISSECFDKNKMKNCKFRIIDKTKLLYKISEILYKGLKKVFKINIGNTYIKKIIKDLKEKKEVNHYDLVIIENGIEYITYFKKNTNTKTKIVLHLHNDYLNINTDNGNEILKSVDEVWVVSDFLKKRIDEINSNSKVRVLHNTYNPLICQINNDEVLNIKNKFNLDNQYVVLYTGRLLPEKGVKELICAFNIFNKEYSNSRLLIVGKKDKGRINSNYYEDLKNVANKNVIFVGFIPPCKIGNYYSISNVQVVPSLCNEAFGLILLEGMKHNKHIIASDMGAIREVCGDKIEYIDANNFDHSLYLKLKNVYMNFSEYPKEYYSQVLSKFDNGSYCKLMYKYIHHILDEYEM